MRYAIVMVFLSSLTVGCTTGGDRIPFPWSDDAGARPMPVPRDGGPPCSSEQAERLRTDFQNCGSCGTYCPVDRADRCDNGHCRCGMGAPCAEETECRMGRCVRSDRFTECDSTDDCNGDGTTGRQACIGDPYSDKSFCVDVCEFDDACPDGFACIEGSCTFLECVPENCDDIDNDCDGEVDENGDGTGPLSRWCYSGPDIDDINPPCRKGVQVCEVGGRWSSCEGEVPPVPEVGLLACDGLDNDCDLCADGTYMDGACYATEPNGFDVLYLIDISGSMSSTISAVVDATSRFSALYAGNPEFRFGLVLIAGSGSMDRRAYVELDFTDFSRFDAILTLLRASGGGSEPTYDAVYESATDEIAHAIDTDGDGVKDTIDETMTGLSWREGSIRIMVMFGDETAQTYRNATRGLMDITETAMCDSLTHGESFTMFGRPSFSSEFDECGTWYDLDSDPDVMFARLTDIITDPCL